MPQDLPQTENDNLKPVNVNDGPTTGNPTTPALSRSVVEGTSIEASNKNLAHVCDFVSEMQKNIQLILKFLDWILCLHSVSPVKIAIYSIPPLPLACLKEAISALDSLDHPLPILMLCWMNLQMLSMMSLILSI